MSPGAGSQLTSSYDKDAAIVVLPAAASERHLDAALRSWLARTDLSFVDEPFDALDRVLSALGRSAPAEGRAALRMWGQTGDRPSAWVAAADPVYLEPRMDHLWLHALDPPHLDTAELRRLVDYLQQTLGDASSFGFARLRACGYVTAAEPIATARFSAAALDQCAPDRFMPAGPDADGHRRVVSEIEMALHEHPVNREREASGLKPVNSLWLWGGGAAPAAGSGPLPPLYSDDPLLHGYWLSQSAAAAPWPGSLAACLDGAERSFVATLPSDDADPGAAINALCRALDSGSIGRLVLLFRDGLVATARRAHRLRFWRGTAALDKARQTV